MTETEALALIEKAGLAAGSASGPEALVRSVMALCHGSFGDRKAHLGPSNLEPGQTQFFVAGAFFITPDGRYQMLVGNTGFPPEQERLTIPIDGGHPGWVVANRKPLLLEDTSGNQKFRQYLKTARMGSAVYAPLLWDGDILGLVIVAAQAKTTMGPSDMAALTAISHLVAAGWVAKGGHQWLVSLYPTLDLSRYITTGS